MQIKVKQRDITDCGAACLASVAAWYRLSIPVARIRQMASTDKKGTNVMGLVEAAEKIGFLAKGVRGDMESIVKVPRPSIMHVIVRKTLHHYVVMLNCTRKYIEIMDPADGRIHRLDRDEFREQWTGVMVILVPGEKFTPGREKISSATRFYQLFRPNRAVLLQALAGALAFSVLGLGMSIYLGKLVDHVLPGGNMNLLNLLGIAMILIILFRTVLSVFQTLFVLKTGQKIDASMILGYYQHLLRLPQSFFDNMRTGEILSRIGDAVKIRLFINEVAIGFALNILILIVSFVLMFTYNHKLALVMLVVIPFYSVIYLLSNRLNRKVQRRVMEKAADLESHLVESLNAAATIRRFNLEDHANYKTETRFTALLDSVFRSGLNGIAISGSSGFVTQIFSLVVLWAGSAFVLNNQITAGELLSFYSIVGYFTGPVTGIIAFNRTYQDARIAADRLFEIFDLEPEESGPGIELKPQMIGDIRFENVKFRYGTRTEVFRSLNLIIRKGGITAITGESGSGKSTLASLLQNIYPIVSGTIRIGDYDIRQFSNSSVRRNISVVPQRIDLFAGTVAENIAAGEAEPDMEKIIEVCSSLGMIRFIEQLPAGFNTWLGENGIMLSGGQKQRIAIARALYNDPEVIILDEATSALDSVAEGFVKSAAELLRSRGKTIIIIAHRFSTISLADRVIVLEGGGVAQEGVISELMTSEGIFRKMWVRQAIEVA